MENKLIFRNLDKSEYRRQEAYNYLRNNLQFSGPDLKSFMLTSCEANTGKSTVSFELARSMAEAGKKVILIDADMRKSVLIKRYEVQAGTKKPRGLTHYLTKQAALEEIVFSTNIEGMDIILSGPASPNPTELLEGKLFDEMILKLEERYDAVIVDTPPLGAVIDAAIMGPKCDGAILILESEVTSYKAAQEVKKQLEMADCKILGTILNKVTMDKAGYYYGYYGYYKYYGEYK
ncbi:MAG: CpsD/CapB family tyrosine-protein kinase [Firmicutes bacterium]|nr:CpsD/CapB family tyrosine-protein kinase [Bacillota bacterium]